MTSIPDAPDWCEPGAVGDTQHLANGDAVVMWQRVIGGVWIGAEDHTIDGRVFRAPARVYLAEPPADGLSGEEARQLAANYSKPPNGAGRLHRTTQPASSRSVVNAGSGLAT